MVFQELGRELTVVFIDVVRVLRIRNFHTYKDDDTTKIVPRDQAWSTLGRAKAEKMKAKL